MAIATQNAHGAVRFSMACILQGEAPLDKAPCDFSRAERGTRGGRKKEVAEAHGPEEAVGMGMHTYTEGEGVIDVG